MKKSEDGGGYLTCPWSQIQVVAESEFELQVCLTSGVQVLSTIIQPIVSSIRYKDLCLSASQKMLLYASISLPSSLYYQRHISPLPDILACWILKTYEEGNREKKGGRRRGRREGFLLIFFWMKCCSRSYLPWEFSIITKSCFLICINGNNNTCLHG